MTELELKQLLSRITRPDETARTAAHAHWASLAKPLGGLGRLETMLEDAAALTGTAELAFSRRAVLVLCADNGVVAQGVSQTDQSVTRAVAENLAARRTSVCQMAKTARCEVVPVDLGMAGEPVPGVQNCRIAAGTADFTKGPAMTRAEAVEAIGRGISLTRQLAAEGYGLVATGEMGIGNTTTSSAVAAVLLAQPVQTMTGRGAGLSDAGLARKVDTIRRGIACNVPNPDDVLDVLGKLGGFDIAGLCGVFLGGALAGVPVLALPARGGRFYDWENNGMPDAIAQLLNEGKVQLFCADAMDGEGLLNGDLPQRRRAELQEKYFVYLTAELAPRILTLNNAKKGTRIWTAGVDLGAYHAVHCRLRRPTLFAGAVGMGGIYDLTRFWGTDSDDMVLRCAPLAYLQENGIANKLALTKAEENRLILCAGQGAYEGDALDDTQALADLLKDQEMPAHLEIWGGDVSHDWYWWGKMWSLFAPRILEVK